MVRNVASPRAQSPICWKKQPKGNVASQDIHGLHGHKKKRNEERKHILKKSSILEFEEPKYFCACFGLFFLNAENKKMTPSLSKNPGRAVRFVLHTDKRQQKHFIKEVSHWYLITLLQRMNEWQPV